MAGALPVSNQLTVPIHFALAPELTPWTINDLLEPIGLEHFTGCDITEWAFPLMTLLPTHNLPALEQLGDLWVPWDEEISEERRIHLLLFDRQLFQDVIEAAADNHNQILLGAPAGQAAVLQYHATLEVHLLAFPEMVEVIGRLHGVMCRMRRDIHALTTQVRDTNERLGRTIETIGAHFPELAHDLGLTLRPADFNQDNDI